MFLILRFFPQWAVDQGLLKEHSPITWFFRQVEKLVRSSNVVAVQSPANLDVFRKIYSKQVELKVLMNWSAQAPYATKPGFDELALRSELNLNSDKVILIYGGNIGHAQDMSNIIRLAKRMRSNEKALFLLIGQGDEFDLVERSIKKFKLKNVILMPSVSQESYRKYVATADIGLFSLSREHSAHNFPGKLLGYMVEGKPILGSVNLGNDVASIISESRSGFVSFNGDDNQFFDDAKLLIEDSSLRGEMGLNAYELLRNKFSVEKAYQVISDSYLVPR